MMIRNKSVVTTSGFTDSYVPIEKALQRIGGISGFGGVIQVAELPATGEESKIYYNTTEKKYYTYTTDDGWKEIGNDNITTSTVKFYYLDPSNFGTGDNSLIYTDNGDIGNTEQLYFDSASNRWFIPHEIDGSNTTVRIEYVNADTDINSVYYLDEFKTWWKFDECQTGPNQFSTRPIHLYTGVMYLRFDDVVQQVSTLDGTVRRATIPLNPAYFCDCGIVDEVIFSAGIYFDYPFLALTPTIGRFAASANDISITLPDKIKPADNNPSITADHSYEYRILDGIFSLIDVTPATV